MKRLLLIGLIILIAGCGYGQQVEIDKTSPEFKKIDSMYVKAEEFTANQDFNNAIQTYKDLIIKFEHNFTKNHYYYGIFLNNLAELNRNIGDHDKALPLYLEALENVEKTLGKNHSSFGVSLNNLASLYQTMGDYDKALPLLLEVIKNIENTIGKNNSSYGTLLNNLAGLYENMGDYNKALPSYIEAIKNIEKTKGKNHYLYGQFLNNLAALYYTIGEYDKALPLYEEALKNIENTLGKNHLNYGNYLNNLGKLYNTIGDYDKALPLYLKALENVEKSLGKNHSSFGVRLNNLAMLYGDMGNHHKALPLYLEAIKNIENTLGINHPNYGSILNNLAGLYLTMGNYIKALSLYTDALEKIEKSLGKNHPNYGSCLNNLVKIYLATENYNEVLPIQIKVLENIKKSLGKNHPLYGIGLNRLGSIYKAMGNYNKALTVYLEALKNNEKTLGRTHSDYGTCLNNLAELYQAMGNYDKALPLYLEAIKNIENTIGQNNSSYQTLLNNLAGLYENMGDYNKALSLYSVSNTITLNEIKQNFAVLTAKEKESFVNNEASYQLKKIQNFNYLTNNKYKSAVTHAINNTLITKGLLLNASFNVLKKLDNLDNDSISTTVANFRSKKTFVNAQLQLPKKKRANNFVEIQHALDSLERNILDVYKLHFGETINYIKDWKDTKLDDNEIAIEFTNFDVYNRKWTDSTMYVAYLYKNDLDTPIAINLFEEKQLKKYLANTSSPNKLYKTRGSKGTSINTTVSADSIYNLIWKPLEKHLKGHKTIYYSPDGLLHKIPFVALPNSENNLLGEVYNLNQMGNTADIRLHNNTPNLSDVVLIGGVNYNYVTDDSKDIIKEKQFSILETDHLLGNENNKKRSSGSGSWTYLKGTQQEVDRIHKLLPKSKVLNNKNATETAFKELSGNGPSVLHIATHGFFFPDIEKKESKDILGNEKP